MQCSICHRELNQSGMPDTADCGGDCVRCMADSEDPECVELIRQLENSATRSRQIEQYEAWRTRDRAEIEGKGFSL